MKIVHGLLTWDNLATMGLNTKSTPPTGLRIATKGGINTYYYVDNSVSPFAGYASNRCPPYESISPIFGGTVSWAPGVCAACNAPSGTVVVTGNGTTFCNSTLFTSNSFSSWSSGNYVLVLGGNSINISTNGTETATMYGGGCQTCPTTTPVWTYVYQTCVSCVNTNVYRDTASCSATYGYYKIGSSSTTYLYDAPTNALCSTGAGWVATGGYYYTCSGSTIITTTIYIDTNTCSSTHNWYKIGTDGTPQIDNPSNSAPTGDSWAVLFGTYECYGCDEYYVEVQLNYCSTITPGGTTRRSSVVHVYGSTTCCPPATCYAYQCYDYGWVSYQDCYGYTYDMYVNPYDSFCAQWASGPCYQTGDLC